MPIPDKVVLAVNRQASSYEDTVTTMPEGDSIVRFLGQQTGGNDYLVTMDVPRFVIHKPNKSTEWSMLGRVVSAVRVPSAGGDGPQVFWLLVRPITPTCDEASVAAWNAAMAAMEPLPRGERRKGPYKKLCLIKTLGVSFEHIQHISLGPGIVPIYV
jgi:hypothetical protein